MDSKRNTVAGSVPRGRMAKGAPLEQGLKKGSEGRRKAKVLRKPVLEVRPSAYAPTKEELAADVSIDATPDELAAAAMRDVTVRTSERR